MYCIPSDRKRAKKRKRKGEEDRPFVEQREVKIMGRIDGPRRQKQVGVFFFALLGLVWFHYPKKSQSPMKEKIFKKQLSNAENPKYCLQLEYQRDCSPQGNHCSRFPFKKPELI